MQMVEIQPCALFYEQKLYDRDLMPNGIYENILTETEAVSLARELLTAQCAKTVADISYLRIMPEYMSIQPYGAKAEICTGDKITEDAILDALDRFSKKRNKAYGIEMASGRSCFDQFR